MTRKARKRSDVVFAILASIGCLSISDRFSLATLDHFSATAEARIGRPMTPMSYAGAARRTTRRVGAVGVYPATGAVVVAPRRCAQVVDAYGRVITRCY